MKHRDDSRKGNADGFFTIAAVITAAAIAAGIILYNLSSEPTGPLPVHLPPARNHT